MHILKDNVSDELNPDKTGLSSYFEDEPIYDFIEKSRVGIRMNP